MSGPLDGAVVVDLSSALAGPISSRLMPAGNAQRWKAGPGGVPPEVNKCTVANPAVRELEAKRIACTDAATRPAAGKALCRPRGRTVGQARRGGSGV